MSTESRPRRLRLRRTSAPEVPDHRLVYLDQASFLSLRATGRQQLMQCVWVYEKPIDLEGLRRYHREFGHGMAGRRIERSPLPFGRHRWVNSPGAAAPLHIDEPRPPEALSDWIDEQSQQPVDPEFGPGWRIAMLPMTDGSTAVSQIGSHTLGDGTAGVVRIVQTVLGLTEDIGYPPPRSRTRLRGALADARGLLADLPETGKALRGAARLAWSQRHDLRGPKNAVPAPEPVNPDVPVVVPAINILIDLPHWDARAEALGGTSYSMLAGFAAKFGEHMGRRNATTGEVMLLVALSERTLEDTRAHAMSFVNVHVDPTTVTSSLTDARTVLREALKELKDNGPDEAFSLLALTPFTPKRAVRGAGNLAFGFDAAPVACSNMGDLFGEFARIDGTDADYCLVRGVDQGVTLGEIERSGGQLVIVAARIVGKISIGIVAYECGAENSKERLRKLAAQTLDEFGLTGTII